MKFNANHLSEFHLSRNSELSSVNRRSPSGLVILDCLFIDIVSSPVKCQGCLKSFHMSLFPAGSSAHYKFSILFPCTENLFKNSHSILWGSSCIEILSIVLNPSVNLNIKEIIVRMTMHAFFLFVSLRIIRVAYLTLFLEDSKASNPYQIGDRDILALILEMLAKGYIHFRLKCLYCSCSGLYSLIFLVLRRECNVVT